MSEGLKELPVPCYLSSEQKQHSRKLYERVFCEDTKKFTDFYYAYKIRDNKILALMEDGQMVSMLHRNPYRMIVNGYEVKTDYIVAVATHEDYRHRGYMRMLMEKALKDMFSEGMPFTFLMPVRESIYAPFDFVWISPHTRLTERVMQMNMEEQNRYLATRYQMFCKRDKRYMENIQAERLAEIGENPSEKMPPYMARITNVCQMLQLAGSREERELYLYVKDSLIPANQGFFQWKVSESKSVARKLDKRPEHVDLELTVGELASMIFGGFRICLSEAV
jgi:Predicted acetyltransferase involved in intracellular survival and related acetyltransferases